MNDILTNEPGVYQLHLVLDEPMRIVIGKLGEFDFPAGRYCYTGSALGGLKSRISRHMSRPEQLHWHIDYLLRYAHLVSVSAIPTRERIECELSRQTMLRPDAKVLVPRFGSSDCRCASHLVYLGELPPDADAPVASNCIPDIQIFSYFDREFQAAW